MGLRTHASWRAPAAVVLISSPLLTACSEQEGDDPLAVCRGVTTKLLGRETQVLRFEGRQVKSTTTLDSTRLAVSLSPDGRRVAYYRNDAASGAAGVFVAKADGSDAVRIADLGFNRHQRPPTWSPHGDLIAFESYVSTGIVETSFIDIVVARADGSRVVNLTNRVLHGSTGPAWSPDQRQLVFSGYAKALEPGEVYVIDADGSNLRRLTSRSMPDAGASWSASWSPSGQLIGFVSNRDVNGEVYVMKPDGTGQTNLTQHPAGDFAPHDFFGSVAHGVPVWSPDGRKMVFQSERYGGGETLCD
jgi:TolB protein